MLMFFLTFLKLNMELSSLVHSPSEQVSTSTLAAAWIARKDTETSLNAISQTGRRFALKTSQELEPMKS